MRRRVQTLVIPYIIWNFVNKILMHIHYGDQGHSLYDINVLDDVILGNASPHLWYVFMLIFWMSADPVLWFIYKHNLMPVLLLSQLVYLIIQGNNIKHSRVIYIIYTWGGYLANKHPELLQRLNDFEVYKFKNLMKAMLFLALNILMYLIVLGDFLPGLFGAWISVVRGILLILFFANMPMPIYGLKTNYRSSFWLYAFHYWLDKILADKVKFYFVKIGIETSIAYEMATLLLVLLVALVIGMLLNKFCHKLFILMTGERNLRSIQ